MKQMKQIEELSLDIVPGYDTQDVGSRISMDGLTLVEIAGIDAVFPDYFTTERYIIQFLMQGEMHAEINLRDVHVKAPCAFVLMPDFVLHFDNATPDTQLFIVSFTNDVAQEMQLPELSFHILNAINNNPVFAFSAEQMLSARRFFDLLKEVMTSNAGNRYAHDSAVSLTRSLIRYTQGFFPERFEQQPNLSRAEELTGDFIAMAKRDCVRERSVNYYAEQLRVSPKYLANVVKESTGRTVGDWLNSYALLRAKVLLTTSHINIQQIAETLNFANQSHFGTWFRRHNNGIGPKEFRQSRQKQDFRFDL